MIEDAFRDGWGWWVIALAVGVPVLLALRRRPGVAA